MTFTLSQFNLRSYLLVLFAFVGNAQVLEVDLTLTLLMPILLFLQIRNHFTILRSMLPYFGLSLALLVLATLRTLTVGIPYFDAYYLWPLKAIILMLFVTFGRQVVWPTGNTLALTVLVVALISVGTVQDERLVSIFGPNMLYRIFGILFMISLIYSTGRSRVSRLRDGFIAVFSLYALLLTGSGGAVVVGLVAVSAFVFRLSKWFAIISLCAGVIFALLYPQINSALLESNSLTSIDRIIYKAVNIEASSRLMGWSEIISQPLTLSGYNHSEFWYIWTFGFQYPHNIFIELYAFFGVMGLLISGFIVLALIKAAQRILDGDVLSMTFVVLLIGSMLSGDLSDNYGVVGLGLGLVLKPRRGISTGTPAPM